MSIEALLLAVPKVDPEAACIEADGRWWSWREFETAVDSVRRALDANGAPAGARIGLLLRNKVPQVAALVACVVSSRCGVGFNPALPAAKLADDVRSQTPAMLVGAEDDLAGEVAETAEGLQIPRLAVAPGPGGEAYWLGARDKVAPDRLVRLEPQVMFEIMSSGTTGPPKRVPLSRRKFNESFASSRGYEEGADATQPVLRSGVRLQTSPPAHISGLFGLLSTLAEGRKLALLDRFRVEEWAAAVQRTRPRVCNLPPAALRMILDANVPKAQLSSLAALRSGAAPVEPAIIDAFQDRYGLPVLVQYGATEFAGAVAGWDVKSFREHYAHKRGSVGRFQPGLEGRVVDADTGREQPPGEVGVLELRGRQVGDTVAWTPTTDLASIDEDGFLWIHGRADGAINRGGFKVHPDEVAQALQTHPSILEASVVGLPERRLGAVPAAALLLRTGQEAPSTEDLRAYLARRLAPYQIPAHFLVVGELPRTPSLKPSLPEVRKLFAAHVPPDGDPTP